MRMRMFVGWMIVAVGLYAGTALAPAQSEPPRERRSFMGLINIDSLVDNYSNFLGRKYNLTDEQAEFTQQLLRQKAHLFWDKNEQQLGTLMDRMFEVRTGGDMNPEELTQWGKSVLPLYNEAKNIIVQGNDEWREILTEEQKKIHDEDVKLMYQSFKTTDDQIERIVTGQMTVEEFRSPSRPGRQNRQPPPPQSVEQTPGEPAQDGSSVPHPSPAGMSEVRRQKQAEVEQAQREDAGGEVVQQEGEMQPGEMQPGADGQPVEQPPVEHQPGEMPQEGAEHPPHAEAAGGEHPPQPEPNAKHVDPRQSGGKGAPGKNYESEWDQYVKQFIARYKLNDEQSQKANAILADCKQQAARVMNAKKAEIDRIDARLVSLQGSKDAGKSSEVANLTQQRQKLLDPLKRIFDTQLKPRVERLPTRAQREAAEAAPSKSAAPAAARPVAPGAAPERPGAKPGKP